MSKFRIISIKKAFLIIFFYIVLFLAYGYYSFTTENERIKRSVSKELILGAQAVDFLLPSDFHRQGFRLDDVTRQTHNLNTQKLARFVAYTDLSRIYSLIRDAQGRIRLSSSSDPSMKLSAQTVRLVEKIFDRELQTPYFVDATQNNASRSVYILKTAPDGYPYVLAAQYKTARIDSLQKHIAQNILYLILPLIVIIALYVFANYFVFIYLKNSLAKKSKALKEAFEYDSLTKLPSKRKLILDIQNMTEITPLAIVDINKFSIINDIYGSEYGDKYLQYTATVLANRLQGRMKLYKLDSDAFAILCHEAIDLERFKEYIAKILKETAHKKFIYKTYGSKLLLTAGISDTARKNNPLIRAEIALKKAKESGDKLCVYSEDIDRNNHNKEVLDDITYAIDNDKVYAYFQPIFDIKSEKIIKYEALMRIEKRDGTIATPAYFLDVAKHTPLYKDLTLIMVAQVIKFAQIHTEYAFSINLSSLDIEDKDLIASLIDSLQKAEVKDRITIEILESEQFKDFDYLFEFIKKTRELGIKVSIDDFGSGYSNISSTIKLDIDYLKIDGSLVRHVLVDSRYEKVLKSIVNFANEMDAKTIAEFVENEAIAQKLQELGIDMLQGYYIGKPQANIKT